MTYYSFVYSRRKRRKREKYCMSSVSFSKSLTISTPREISRSTVSLSDLSTEELTDERSDSG